MEMTFSSMRSTRAIVLALGIPAVVILTAMSTLADSSPSPTGGGAATGAQALPGEPTSLDPAFLIDIITNGRKPQSGDPRSTAMPAKGGNTSLTDQDVKDLAAYIIVQNRSGSPPLSPGELAKRTILWVSIGIIAMIFVTYLLATYNMRWIARRAAARRK